MSRKRRDRPIHLRETERAFLNLMRLANGLADGDVLTLRTADGREQVFHSPSVERDIRLVVEAFEGAAWDLLQCKLAARAA